MASLLRILSQANDGTVEGRIIPLNHIMDFKIVVKFNDASTVESLVEGDKENGSEAKEGKSNTQELDEGRLVILRSDGTELEVDLTEGSYSFEIRDDEGEIIVETDNLFKLEQGFLVSHIISETEREKKVRELRETK